MVSRTPKTNPPPSLVASDDEPPELDVISSDDEDDDNAVAVTPAPYNDDDGLVTIVDTPEGPIDLRKNPYGGKKLDCFADPSYHPSNGAKSYTGSSSKQVTSNSHPRTGGKNVDLMREWGLLATEEYEYWNEKNSSTIGFYLPKDVEDFILENPFLVLMFLQKHFEEGNFINLACNNTYPKVIEDKEESDSETEEEEEDGALEPEQSTDKVANENSDADDELRKEYVTVDIDAERAAETEATRQASEQRDSLEENKSIAQEPSMEEIMRKAQEAAQQAAAKASKKVIEAALAKSLAISTPDVPTSSKPMAARNSSSASRPGEGNFARKGLSTSRIVKSAPPKIKTVTKDGRVHATCGTKGVSMEAPVKVKKANQPEVATRKARKDKKERPVDNNDLEPHIKPDLLIARKFRHASQDPSMDIRQIVPYPAPVDILEASQQRYFENLEAATENIKKGGKADKIPWTVWEDDLIIEHMLDIRLDASIPETEARFEEVSERLRAVNNVHRTKVSIKNMWNRVGRARSGFDERKRKTEVFATSQQTKKRGRENDDLEEGEIRELKVQKKSSVC